MFIGEKMEELPLNVKIKQEKLTPEREVVKAESEEIVEPNLNVEEAVTNEAQDIKEEIEPTK